MDTPNEEQTLSGRVAVVTGGGRGIGAATARRLAGSGAAVAVAARDKDQVGRVADEISAAGGRALPMVLDVTDEGSVREVFWRVREELGPATLVINNAGFGGVPLPVAATELSDWQQSFAVNVTGAMLCARAALPGMVAANWGRIVNVSSAAARHPVAGMSAYSASKAALDQLTRVLAAEGEPYGILAFCVYPGVVDTEMQQESRSLSAEVVGRQLHRMFNNYHDLDMLRAPEEPAELIHHLCTADTARLNGHIIRVEQLDSLRER